MRPQLPGRAEFRPRRRNDQQRRLRAALGERLQHVERGRIGPVQVLEREHQRLGAGAGEHPGGERRELAAAQFLRRQFRRAAGGSGASITGASSGAYSAGVEPDRAERRLEFGEALFAGDFGAAEAGAAPFGDGMQRRVLQQLRGRPLDPGVRRLRQPGAELLDQPRFAEARLADDQRELAFAAARALPAAREECRVPRRGRPAASARASRRAGRRR